MAIGLKYGRVDVKEDNKQVFEKVKEFLKGFKERYHKQDCIDLTNTWREKGTFTTPERKKYCSVIVKFAASEVERII